MTLPAFTLTISRTALPGALAPLALDGRRGATPLLVVEFTEPAMEVEHDWAPDDPEEHGSLSRGWSYRETYLPITVKPNATATEAASRLLLAELRAAVTKQTTYTVAVAYDGAPAESWACKPGSMSPASGRSTKDLTRHDPEWALLLPAHPIPTLAEAP